MLPKKWFTRGGAMNFTLHYASETLFRSLKLRTFMPHIPNEERTCLSATNHTSAKNRSPKACSTWWYCAMYLMFVNIFWLNWGCWFTITQKQYMNGHELLTIEGKCPIYSVSTPLRRKTWRKHWSIWVAELLQALHFSANLLHYKFFRPAEYCLAGNTS